MLATLYRMLTQSIEQEVEGIGIFTSLSPHSPITRVVIRLGYFITTVSGATNSGPSFMYGLYEVISGRSTTDVGRVLTEATRLFSFT